ncbi:unnamed protein product [Meloidogyne enterolobii]|uniref:Uncharacterized protein n=1 Tax=Meloidogyne enterolobii TaxID=390850 RepID=A0ACB1AEN4_MELEN
MQFLFFLCFLMSISFIYTLSHTLQCLAPTILFSLFANPLILVNLFFPSLPFLLLKNLSTQTAHRLLLTLYSSNILLSPNSVSITAAAKLPKATAVSLRSTSSYSPSPFILF